MTEFCPKCGNQRTASFRFCRSCGFDFDAAPAVSAPAVPRDTAPSPTIRPPAAPAYRDVPRVPPSPAAATPAKGRSAVAERVVVLAIFVALGIGGLLVWSNIQTNAILSEVGDAFGTTAPRPATQRPATPAPADEFVVSMGTSTELVDTDGADLGSVTVHDSQRVATLMELPPTGGTRFVAALVEYVAVAPWAYNLYDWSAHDQDLRQFEPYGIAPDPMLSAGSLAPGRSAEGWVAFEVPEDTGELWLDMQAADGSVLFSVRID